MLNTNGYKSAVIGLINESQKYIIKPACKKNRTFVTDRSGVNLKIGKLLTIKYVLHVI